MMLARGVLILATLAALVGAPGNASAAGNEPGAGQASRGSDSTSTDTAKDAAQATEGILNLVLIVGLSGVAALALIGVAMMLTGRRRDHDDGTSAAESRPALRQARVRMTDDPIVAALGVGNDDDDRRRARRKAGQVGRGPGERPNISRS